MPERIKLIVEYDGTNYSGWQRQINAMSVQQRLEEGLKKLTGESITVTGSSRTDAGVHSKGQTVHFDMQTPIPSEKVAFALNTCLPHDIRVTSSCAVPGGEDGFHARFGATGKVYRYMIYNSPHASALSARYTAHVSLPLDENLMNAEAQAMIGRHDFCAFAASGSVAKDTVREMYRIGVTRRGHRVMLLVHGNGFLYNMVRILAGTLIEVGAGKREPGAIARALESGSRLDLGITAPPQGLTLLRVFYGDDERAADVFDDPDVML